MSNVHELEISIDPSGQVTVHIKGAKGKSCLEYTRWLTEVIGPQKSRSLTSEYYEPEGQVRVDIHGQASE